MMLFSGEAHYCINVQGKNKDYGQWMTVSKSNAPVVAGRWNSSRMKRLENVAIAARRSLIRKNRKPERSD